MTLQNGKKSVRFSSEETKGGAANLNNLDNDLLSAFQLSRKRKQFKKGFQNNNQSIEQSKKRQEEEEEEEEEDDNRTMEPSSKRRINGPLTLKDRIHQSVEAKLQRKQESEMLDELRDDVDDEWNAHIRFLIGKKPENKSIATKTVNAAEKSLELLNMFDNEVRDLQMKTSAAVPPAKPVQVENLEEESDNVPRDSLYCMRVYAKREPNKALAFLCCRLVNRTSTNPARYFMFSRVVLEILESQTTKLIYLPELKFAFDFLVELLFGDDEKKQIPSIPAKQLKKLSNHDLLFNPDDFQNGDEISLNNETLFATPLLWLKCVHQLFIQMTILLDQLSFSSAIEGDELARAIFTPIALRKATIAKLYSEKLGEKLKIFNKKENSCCWPLIVNDQVNQLTLRLNKLDEFLDTVESPVFALKPKIQMIPLMDPCLTFEKEEEKKRMSRLKREKKASMKTRKRNAKQRALELRDEIIKKSEERQRKTKKLITQLKSEEWQMNALKKKSSKMGKRRPMKKDDEKEK